MPLYAKQAEMDHLAQLLKGWMAHLDKTGAARWLPTSPADRLVTPPTLEERVCWALWLMPDLLSRALKADPSLTWRVWEQIDCALAGAPEVWPTLSEAHSRVVRPS